MDAAKDLIKRAVELDSAQKYTEALICYEEGIQNILRAMRGQCTVDEAVVRKPVKNVIFSAECTTEEKKRELRKKAEEYLARAEKLKERVKEEDGEHDIYTPRPLIVVMSPLCSAYRESSLHSD